MPMPELKHNTR